MWDPYIPIEFMAFTRIGTGRPGISLLNPSVAYVKIHVPYIGERYGICTYLMAQT